MSDFDAERQANIARNKALLAQLDIKFDIPIAKAEKPKVKAKPVQPSKKRQREKAPPPPPRETRQSSRLKKTVDPNETPAQRKMREKEEEEARKKAEAERLAAEEKEREAKRPRHQDLDISTLAENLEAAELSSLTSTLQIALKSVYAKRSASQDSFVFDEEKEEEAAAVSELKEKLGKLKVVARAKVTQDRIYSAAYHPEVTKDLIFFGDKHGQLGIWDALAPAEEVADEDDDVVPEEKEGGKHWRLQAHWPATSKSSISTVKFDPIDAHRVYTSAYDCTVRCLSFASGLSREIFSTEDVLISSIDLHPSGNEMWISDALGGVTHLDLREDKSKAKWYQLSDQKIGSVSINPVQTHFLLTASNNRTLKVWDARKLEVAVKHHHKSKGPIELDSVAINNFLSSKDGKSCLRGEWRHDKSVSSAYWDPRGRSVVSTSYDDHIRLWDIRPNVMSRDVPFPSFRPIRKIHHDCQTGKWLTILKAQWSPNPDVYPHFTIGNMKHSLDIFSCKGELLARLHDPMRITAVQAVTCSHPSIMERAASGNASGRCVLWAPADE